MGVKKFILPFVAMSLFAVPQAFAKVLTLGFTDFKNESVCRAMSITGTEASRLEIAIDTAHIKNDTRGVPSIVWLSGASTGQPPFTQAGLGGLYAYITAHPFPLKFNAAALGTNDSYTMRYIFIKSVNEEGQYTGTIRVDSGGKTPCMIHIAQK